MYLFVCMCLFIQPAITSITANYANQMGKKTEAEEAMERGLRGDTWIASKESRANICIYFLRPLL